MKKLSFLKLSLVASALVMFNWTGRVALADPPTAQIIDGTRAPAVDFPAVAKMSFPDTVCTGTLIASKYVLSAAHCFYNDNNKKRTDIDQMGAVVGNVLYKAKSITIHPTYVSRSSACVEGETDAAIMELLTEVTSVTPIPLDRDTATVGTDLLLAGFGTQGTGNGGEDGTFPDDGFLNFGFTKVESVPSNNYVEWTFDQGESNTAGGDSGGPAFSDKSGTRYLHSITCGGTGNAGFGTSSTNTRVDTMAAWIDSITGSSAPNQAPASLGLSTPKTGGVGVAFSYTIQATGTAPVSVTTSALPDGLTQSGNTISGTPTTAGTFTVDLTATNSVGTATGQLTIAIAPFNPETGLTLRKATVNFEDESDDLLALQGTIVIGKNFKPKGKKVRVQVAGLVDNFKLNSQGFVQRRNGYDLVELIGKFNSKGAFASNKVRFYIGLGDKDSLFDQLDTLFPIDTDSLTDDFRVNLPVEIQIGDIIYSATIAMKYNSRNGKWVNG